MTDSMEVHELIFYSQFQCTMGNCPNTCCHGWQIVFDDEARARFLAEPGLAGLRLRRGITRRNGMTMFRRRRGSCPFLTRERACGIQLSLGEDYMPDVCRIFPRQRVNYGLFAEETLFLACPEAARLFLRHHENLFFRTVERPVDYARLGNNDDPAFLRELLALRQELTDRIADTDMARDQLCTGLLHFAGRLQQYYIKKAGGTDTDVRLPQLRDCIKNAAPSFRITAEMTDRMITGGFYHIFLKKTSPFLYRLCRMYFSEFGRLTRAQADACADRLRAGLHKYIPALERILRGHLIYYLMLEFLTAYENYSFVRILATGILHMHLLELFLAVYYENTHSLTEDELSRIIAVLDRRGRHCAEVESGMYKVIEPLLAGL